MANTYTPEDMAEAKLAYEGVDGGLAAASVKCNIPSSTIGEWAQKFGWHSGMIPAENVRKRALGRLAKMTEAKAELAERLLEDAEKMRQQLFAPSTVFNWTKDGAFGTAQIDEPPAADKRNLVTSIAIIIDKVQLIMGEATSRNEEIKPQDVKSEIDRLAEELIKRKAA